MKTLDLKIGGGLLHARTVGSLSDITLGDFSGERQRLALFVPSDVMLDEPLAHYLFNKALGQRGLINVSDHLHALVGEFSRIAGWLAQALDVTVASYDTAEMLAALVLVAAEGRTAPAAIEEVSKLSPEFEWLPEAEIPISVFVENLRAREES